MKLKGYDITGKPGTKCKLRCRLQTSNLLGFDIAGIEIQFSLQNEIIGSAVTDRYGVAKIEYTFTDYGLFEIGLNIRQGKYAKNSGKIVAGIFNNEKPILICDIDHTLCKTNLFYFFLNLDKRILAIPGSSLSLNRIKDKYHIIYVTHRDDAFICKTKYWLDLRGFPAGPVFFWNYGRAPFSNEKYKEAIVGNLKKQFENIVVGIGDKLGDAFAYHTNGIRAVILNRKNNPSVHPHILQAQDWEQIEQYLIKILE